MAQDTTPPHSSTTVTSPSLSDQQADFYQATTMAGKTTNSIIRTTTVGQVDPIVTDLNIGDPKTVLQSSYSDITTVASQFPMQHATQQLPNVTVSMTTTDNPMESASSITVTDSVITTSGSADSSSISISSSQISSTKGLTDSVSTSTSSSFTVSSSSGSSANASTTSDLHSFIYEPSVSESNSATGIVSSASTSNVLLTSMDSSTLGVHKDGVTDATMEVGIQASNSVAYVPSTGDLYSPVVPSKTVFSTGPVAIDSSTFKSTSAIPISPTGKPVNTVDSGSTALFGGGFTDYILYIGVPVCGLVILIFLIVCIVCLRKRKNVNKGSPIKNHVQDLWVNSQQDIPLTRDPLRESIREANGGESISGRRDLGCTTYEAVFDFQGELETHLTLKQGDLVRVHRKEGNGWWRGTLGDKTGWFPNNYVQAAPQDKLETEDEIEMHSESNVSSFMVQPRHTPNLRDSLPSEKDIEAEPIYCKIQPKEQRKSFPKVPDKSPPKLAPSTRENGTTPMEEGSKFIVIYSSGGHFTGELTINKGDIIVGKELDNNGWMKGVNESTNQEGWCPTVYVDSLDKDEIKQLEPLTLPTSESQTSLSPDPLAYKQLESNTSSGDMKDWVGIVHKAVQPFNAEKAGDLAFDKGDLITVFQVLENGWWLGSKGKSVGWFPAPCVEMIPQPSPRLPSHRLAPSPSNASQSSGSPGSSEEGKTLTDNMNSTSPSKPSKLRPVRKAPPPPLRIDGSTDPKVSSPSSPRSLEGSESKIPTPSLNQTPKIPRAVRGTPPAPPVRDEPYDPLYDVVGKGGKTEHISGPVLIQTTRDDGFYDLIQHTNGEEVDKKLNDGSKPDVPIRYIKPKLVTIPRSELNIPQTAPPNRGHGSPCIARPKVPPPPRPIGPPKVPADNAKVEVDNKQRENEEETFFHLPPQNRFDGIPRSESPEPDPVQSPYKALSSFGSTFGKKEQSVGNKDYTILENAFENPIMYNDKQGQFAGQSDRNKMDNPDTNIDNCAIISTVDTEFDNMPKDEFVTPSVENNLINGGIQEPRLYSAFAGESVKPDSVNNVESENVLDDINERSDNVTVNIVGDKPVKKKEKPISRIPPPKHISLKQSHAEAEKPSIETKETVVAEKDTPKQTRIPMTRKDSPAKHTDRRKDSSSECETIGDTSPIKHMNEKTKDVNDSKFNDSAVIDYTDITKGNSPQDSQQVVPDLENGDEAMRQRSESFNKPPVAPKPKAKGVPKLIKPGTGSKSPESPNDLQNQKADHTNKDKSDAIVCEDNENKVIENADSKAKDSKIVSKLPKIAQKSPKVKKSGIPASPLMRMKNSVEKTSKPNKQPKLSESDSDAPLSPTANPTNKVESPSMARRGAAKQMAESDKSIRNRSNSPHGRTGIPSSLKQRSNSPASSKLPKAPNSSIPSPGSPSPAHTPTSVPKQSGLVPPKKITTPKGRHSPLSEPSSPISLTQSPDTSFDNTDDDQDGQVTSPKPDRPSKPPRLVKQKSQDGKAQKHGRSLLPIIHKSMDSGTNGTIANKPPKSGIPLSKSLRPPATKTTTEDVGNRGPTLFQAVRGYTAQTDEELSFAEGTFVTELSDCDRVGWFVGMLADGTTGLYQADFFTPRPLDQQQSEA